MMECVGPELGREVGTAKHSTDGIADGTMGTLTRTVLMGGVRGSGFDCIAGLFKQVNDFLTATKFTAEIKTHELVGDIYGKAILSEPMIEEIDGRGLGPETFTVQGATEMIDD
jgi:hypothetical protein